MRPIIINGRFLLHRTTGVERYAREIIAELNKAIPAGSITMAVPPEIENVPVYQNIKVIKTGKFKNRLWEHISFPWYVHKQKGISLNLCNVAPLPSPGIVCIHDVKIKTLMRDCSAFLFPTFYEGLRIIFWEIFRRAKAASKSI